MKRMRKRTNKFWIALSCMIVAVTLIVSSVALAIGFSRSSSVTADSDNCSLLIDIAKESSQTALTHESIQEMMDGYAAQGLKQIYFVPIPDTYAVTDSCQGSVLCDPSLDSDHMHRTVHATLDPNLAFITACQKAGMDAIVLYSPYEGGGSVTAPTTAEAQFSMGELETVGGNALFSAADSRGLSELLIASKPSSTATEQIATLEIVFVNETFTNQTSANRNTAYTPSGNTAIVPSVWVSKDNINYTLEQGCSYEITDGTRVFTDANGASLGEKACRIVEIDVSNCTDVGYYAVAFENGDELYTVPFSMINGYDAEGNLAITTKAIYTRNPHSDSLLSQTTVPSDYFWGSERLPISTDDGVAYTTFQAWGFEFQYGGIGSDYGDGWHNAYVYGIAAGEQSVLRGNLSESSVAVREYWLGRIDRFYQMGASSVIVSLENSGGMVYDYTDYGFNDVYVTAYQELYGVDILTSDFDYLNLMKLRGTYFMEFLREVEALADELGKKWGIELFSSFETQTLDDDLNGLCHYRMPKIAFDWKMAVDLCDIVLVKDYQFGTYSATVASEIRAYAKNWNRQVVVMGYEDCGVNAEFIADALNDSLNSRVVVDSASLFTKLPSQELTGLDESISLLGNGFRFFLPDADDTNLLSQTYSIDLSNVTNKLTNAVVLNHTTLDISSSKVAYIAYRLKNTGETELSIGTRLNINCGVTRQAGASLPLVYDVTTGAKLNYTVNQKLRSDSTLRTVKIPAGQEVFMVIPLTCVATDNYIPTLQQAANGNLIARNTTNVKTTKDIEAQYASRGYLYLTSFQLYCVETEGAFEVSQCYATSMEEYRSRYNEFDFTMQEGASVRLSNPTGLRFTATVDRNDWNYLVNRYGAKNVTVGTLIVPATYATEAGGVTFEKLEALSGVTTKYLNVETDSFYKRVGSQYVIAGSIVGIHPTNYSKEYTGVSYIKVVDGEKVIYLYASDPQTRSISYVASEAVKDATSYTQDELKLLNGFVVN